MVQTRRTQIPQRPCTKLGLRAASILCSLLLLSPTAVAADKVYPKQGVPASGSIKALSPTQVTITVRGKDQNYAMSDVLKISFNAEPNGLERARDQFVSEQYDQALEEIKKVSGAEVQNTAIRQDIEFYRWYCEGKMGLTGQGDKAAAIRGLLALASANPKTHHLFDLGEMLGSLHLAIGQPDKAAKYFGVLLNAPDPDTKARGVYQLANVELSQNKNTEARTRYSQLTSAPSASAEMTRLKSLAEVGLAVCDQRDGKNNEALNALDALIDKYPSTEQELFARIYNAKGDCLQALDQPVQALLSYLKTDLLFSIEAEAHAEALYHLKSLWSEYGNPAKSADAGQRLVSQYSSSSWANRP